MHAIELGRLSARLPPLKLYTRPRVRVQPPRRVFICAVVAMAGSNGPSPAKKAKTGVNGVFAKHSVCLVLDYGSQYTQLIARRVRENGVLSVLLPGDVTMVSGARACGDSFT